MIKNLEETTIDEDDISIEKTYISYKEQVLTALYVLYKNFGIKRITSEELRKYRIKIAETFATNRKLLTLEANKEAIEKFKKTYSNEIYNTTENDEITYTIKDEITLSEIEALVWNNVSSTGIMEILSSPRIIEEALIKTKKQTR
ncbi:MAG: hypothetical protein HFE04_01075 [Bacilli bacterium]|nr:hypothetical protein [Bacilli bacterium]